MHPSAPALLNDLYQFTMAQAYLDEGIARRKACFELFFRRAPAAGGFILAAGIGPVLDFVEGFRLGRDEVGYLRSLGIFGAPTLERLARFRFHGDIDAVPEGTLVLPGEPILRVAGPIFEAQLLETPLLNLVGFASSVATRAASIKDAAGSAEVMEFGCRRAPGPDGAVTASRAAFIGGCDSTSNLEAGRRFGIPVRGTMAHSFVLSHRSEHEAFRAYARAFPEGTVLLVDTIDTIRSGVPNAIAVAREMEARGDRLRAVRIDSGDLGAIAERSRELLDAAGLAGVKIIASGDLDEDRIRALRERRAPIDVFGVGTKLVTGQGDGGLSCIYKLVAIEGRGGRMEPRKKRSDDPGKATLPGMKQVYRLYGADGLARGDCLDLARTRGRVPEGVARPLLRPMFRRGKRVEPSRPLAEIQAAARASIEEIPLRYRRANRPATYPVRISPAIRRLRSTFEV